jgi:hypothetical protein
MYYLRMEECAICFEKTKTDSYINGCSHKFCFDCISKWAVNNRAVCPLCNQPIFGLVSDELYLSPHYGHFGITYKNSFNQLQVESIVANSVASIHGIKEGDKLYVNGNTTFEQCVRSIKEARKRGRMIHVKAHSPNDSPHPQKMHVEDCCFWRFWRAKTMPQ